MQNAETKFNFTVDGSGHAAETFDISDAEITNLGDFHASGGGSYNAAKVSFQELCK